MKSQHILPLSFNDDNFSQMVYTLQRFFEYALTLVKKTEINFCYIGTALHDQASADFFFNAFAFLHFNNLKVSLRTSKLALTTNPKPHEIEKHLRKQDIIFIGGGDTEFMLENWKQTGFENILNKLKDENCLPVLMGLSAGGSFPFQSGISLTADNTEYKILPGYDWLQGSFTPHSTWKTQARCTFDQDKMHNRMSAFDTAIKKGLLPPGYAISEDCMLHFCNGKLVGAFSARENSSCVHVSADTVKQITPTLLKRETSSQLAIQTLTALKDQKEPSQDLIYANSCALI